MNNELHRLVYISNNCIQGTSEEMHAEIESILAIARKANTAVGITGALMFNAGCFAQVLEGPQDPLEETFERIQSDTRHDDVVVLFYEQITTREFDNWSMAYVGDNTEALLEYASVKSDSGFDADKIPAERIFGLLQEHLRDAENGGMASAA